MTLHYVKTKYKIKLDKWQQQVLAHDGNIAIRAGRQVGKSTVVARKAAEFARNNPGTITMIIAAAQRQAMELFEKTRVELENMMEDGEVTIRGIPTATKIVLENDSRVYCLPSGRTGWSIRSYTIDLLIADEAAFIPEAVWISVTPMLAVSRKMRDFGWIILLSTPFGKGGYFFDAFNNPDFKTFHVSSEKCYRIDEKFLESEKKRMTRAQYAQEYLGQFVDELSQFFPTNVIKSCVVEDRYITPGKGLRYLGVDIARYGSSTNAFVGSELEHSGIMKILEVKTTARKALTDTMGRIIAMDKEMGYRRIFIDDAGLGAGVYDLLVEKTSPIRRKIIGINNSSRSVETQGLRTKSVLKEDLYSNALCMMEAGRILLPNSPSLMGSLKAIRYEYTSEGRLKIFGRWDHIAEAFVRACWGAKDKGLRCFIA